MGHSRLQVGHVGRELRLQLVMSGMLAYAAG